jgi:UPF0271 protein
MTRIIDLNSDMGESFGNYKIGQDDEVIKYITSSNIACGFHAGDPNVMRYTVKLAKENNVAIGAHPGFPDLPGFGRRKMDIPPEEIKNLITYQIGALQAIAKAEGMSLQHVKPHGAFYNTIVNDKKLGQAVVEAILEINKDLILVGLANSKIINIGLSNEGVCIQARVGQRRKRTTFTKLHRYFRRKRSFDESRYAMLYETRAFMF